METDERGDYYDFETPEGIKEFEKEAYRSFLSFPEGVEYNEEDGTVILKPTVQAQIVMSIHNLRREHGNALNVLGALKFMVKTQVKELPVKVQQALVLADAIIEDPEDVDIIGVPLGPYSQNPEELN